MVGLIPKLLIDLIESQVGAEAVAEVKRRAELPEDREFRLGEVYDDDEWRRLFAATCQVLQMTPEQAEYAFADFFMSDGLRRWPTWFKMSNSAREFLERQPAIHNSFATGAQDPQVRKGITDKFRLEKRENELVTRYKSPNQLCGLYVAMAEWAINHYGDHATVRETQCSKRGDPECEIHICWN